MSNRHLSLELDNGAGILFVSTIATAFSLSTIPTYTIGILAPEISKSYGWSMASVMGGMACLSITVFLASPLVGLLVDRIGPKPVIIASTGMFSLAFVALAVGPASRAAFYATWIGMAAFGTGTTSITWTRILSQVFQRNRAFAIGLSMLGAASFSIIVKPLLPLVVKSFGWRVATIGLGLLPLTIVLPLAACLLPRGMLQRDERARALPTSGSTIGEAARSFRFWLLTGSVLCMSGGMSGVISNLEPILGSIGTPPSRLALATPWLGVGILFSRLVGGWILDRVWAPLVGFGLLIAAGCGCFILTISSAIPALAGALWLIGCAAGIEFDVLAYIVSRYFGLRYYGAIFGMLYGFVALGSSVGPISFAWTYGVLNSYFPILLLASLLFMLSALPLLALGRYRYDLEV